MWGFLQANWLWIVLGLSVLFMFRMHGGGGCGMGHGSHRGNHEHEDAPSNDGGTAEHAGHGTGGMSSTGDAGQDAAERTVPAGNAGDGSTSKTPAGHRHGGC